MEHLSACLSTVSRLKKWIDRITFSDRDAYILKFLYSYLDNLTDELYELEAYING